jgi:hypothetical protein
MGKWADRWNYAKMYRHPSKLIHNEQIKLAATFMNNVAAG